MTTALNTLTKLNFKKTTINSYDNNELDNNELHDLLNDECVYFQTLCDQDTWSFSDGSYITRNQDDYFDGDDISEFELTDSLS